jgi:hypothetical protein
MIETSRRSLIKGIGAAICVGITPKFVKAALPEEVRNKKSIPDYKSLLEKDLKAKQAALTKALSAQMYGDGTQKSVKEAIARANWENANRHVFWDNVDVNGKLIQGHGNLSAKRVDKGYPPRQRGYEGHTYTGDNWPASAKIISTPQGGRELRFPIEQNFGPSATPPAYLGES